MKTIKIIIDENVHLIHLLNSQDYEVIETKRENVFAMTKREVVLGTGDLKLDLNGTGNPMPSSNPVVLN